MTPPRHRPSGGGRLERRLAGCFDRARRWADRRLGATSPVRAALRRAYPDPWAFLFGEIALYCLVMLVVTGLFLSFFYVPDVRGQVTYQGPYAPLRGQPVTEAFNSVMRISFEVPAGLLVRQTHHSLPDDLMSGMSLQVVWSAVLAIPVIGPEVAYLLFGGEFSRPETIPRLFVLHTMLLPALLVGLVAVHLGTVVSRRRQRDLRPARAFVSTSLLLLVAAVLALLGGVARSSGA
jgi:ubiquinol-cytochrome c reductase cytochrome b subunit